jgi:ABC-type phosphate transport system substrate-binding protein
LLPALDAPSSDRRQQVASQDALAIIVHRSNPVDELTSGELRRIFMFETQTWPNRRRITVVLRQKGQPERIEAIRLICGLTELEYDRHVLFQVFRGKIARGPRSILSAGAMLRFVFNAPGAIGYVPEAQLDGSTKVLRIDGVLPGDAGYPLQRADGRDQNRARK